MEAIWCRSCAYKGFCEKSPFCLPAETPETHLAGLLIFSVMPQICSVKNRVRFEDVDHSLGPGHVFEQLVWNEQRENGFEQCFRARESLIISKNRLVDWYVNHNQPEKALMLRQLAERIERNKGQKKIRNGSLPAGFPMIYYCKACEEGISMPERHSQRGPFFCNECNKLKKSGLL